jgi:hypothetical protein
MDNLTYDLNTSIRTLWNEFLIDNWISSTKDLIFSEWKEYVCKFYSIDEEYLFFNDELMSEINGCFERIGQL